MNIYLVIEDNESFCIKAETMHEAVTICEASFLEDQQEDLKESYDHISEKEYYHKHVLQSCALVGELKN